MLPVLVPDAVGIVRSLGDVGIPSIVVSEHEENPMFWSRRCVARAVMPSPRDFPADAARAISEAAREFPDRPVVMTGRDPDALIVSRNREDFSRHMRIKTAPAELMETLTDKRKFADLAERNGIPTPRSFAPADVEELMRLSEELSFPCLLKPHAQELWRRDDMYTIVGRWKKAYLARDHADLVRAWTEISKIDRRFLIQEYIPGGDDTIFELQAYCDRPGHVAGFFLDRKIRTFPAFFGQGCYIRSWRDPAIEKVAVEALEKIGYLGPANIDVKRDPTTGKVAVLEINPRFSLWCHLASRCGVNLPHAMYNDCTGLPLPRLVQKPTETRALHAYFDFLSYRQYRKTGEWSFFSWIGSLLYLRMTFYRWDFRDPLPLIRTFFTHVGLHAKWFSERLIGNRDTRHSP
ncbi:MAG: hypothetical protein V1798_04115 [Pseudomonadota bacterium]